jgi:hypothetical protein
MKRLLVLATIVLAFAGCAKRDIAGVDKPETTEVSLTAADNMPGRIGGRGRVGGSDALMQRAAPPPAPAMASVPPPQAGPVPVPQERKLIRAGRAMLEVVSVDAALARLRNLTEQAGGYTTSEMRSRDHLRVNRGEIECRIPTGKLDSLTAALKSIGTVESLSVTASDVTEEYFDLEIRLRNQRALETRLLALLQRPANKLSDLLDAERELARVRDEIDQMEGRRRFWDNRVALSSLSVSVHEPVPAVGGNRGGAISVLRQAFADSADNFVSAVAGVIAATGAVVPVAAALILAGWLLVRAWRWRRGRRLARQAAPVAAASSNDRR